jgi:tetratricopeptide (TPR) repeat protein
LGMRIGPGTADAIALGRRRGNHLSLGHAVMLAGHLGELMDDWSAVQKSDDETLAVASEFDLSGFPARIVPRKRLAAIALNCDQVQMDSARRHPTPSFARPLHDGVLARAYGRRGSPEEGLRIIETALIWTRETGSQFFDAELYRRRAALFVLTGQLDDAESSYHKALEIARSQRARMWELKAASGLARLLRDQRRREEALEILSPAYCWFREGLETNALRKAKALLDELREFQR